MSDYVYCMLSILTGKHGFCATTGLDRRPRAVYNGDWLDLPLNCRSRSVSKCVTVELGPFLVIQKNNIRNSWKNIVRPIGWFFRWTAPTETSVFNTRNGVFQNRSLWNSKPELHKKTLINRVLFSECYWLLCLLSWWFFSVFLCV